MIGFVTPDRLHDPDTALWTQLRFATRPAPIADLLADYPGNLSAAFDALSRWSADGLIERTHARPETYIMSYPAQKRRDPPPSPPARRIKRPAKTRCGRRRIWSAIRILKKFDIVQLCMAAEVKRPAALAFLNALTRAGYLVRTEREPKDVPAWRLVRHPGPHQPTFEHGVGEVWLFDRNTGERFDVTVRRGEKNLAGGVKHVR